MAIGYNINLRADGLTEQTAAVSARAIKIHHPSSTSGIYWLKNPNVNSGNPIQVYCDMETDGGGWMLIVQNCSINGGTKMNYTNYSLNNQTNPPNANSRANATYSYSILAWADYFKNPNKKFEYMLEGYERNSWGGIWVANDSSYTFNQTTNSATNITLKQKFSTYTYPADSGIEARMPWVNSTATSSGKLTTSANSGSNWWGTIIEASSSYSPAPWLSDAINSNDTVDHPGVIWYWMRGL